MTKLLLALALLAIAGLLVFSKSPRRVVQLPPGEVLVHSPIGIGRNIELRGAPSGTTLVAAPDFHGAAVIVVRGAGVRLHGFAIDGNRDALEVRAGLPSYDMTFARFTANNGVFANDVTALTIDNLTMRNIAGFAILVSNSHSITIDRIRIAASGSRNANGRNNSTGGILLEEGTTDFRVTNCNLHAIRGNGIWTHSLYTSPRDARGLIALNRFAQIGRDAIQVGHARDIQVEENTGIEIGFPAEDVDAENRAIPVAIDTAGNVEDTTYAGNRFEEVNGKCIDLDGFHDGEVRGNECVNRAPAQLYRFGGYGIVMNNTNPDMQSRNIRVVDNVIDKPLYGGIFVIGTGHLVARNRLLNLNEAHSADPVLESGIYLGKGAERPAPARGNIVEDNQVSGYEMKTHCIGMAYEVDPKSNTVRRNVCK